MAGRLGARFAGAQAIRSRAPRLLQGAGLVGTLLVTIYITRLATNAVKNRLASEPEMSVSAAGPPAQFARVAGACAREAKIDCDTYPKLDSATEVLLEHEVQRLGRHLHDELKGRSPGIFRPAFWQGLIMQWAMENPALRTDLFRLVDVLPALSSSAEVARHAREYLLVPGRTLPPGMDQALQLTRHRLAGTVSAFVIRRNVQHLAAQLLAGDSARDAAPRLRKLWREGYAFAVDLLGEATLGGAEADAYLHRYTELINFLPPETARWKSQPLLDVAPRANISIKLSALDPQLDPLDLGRGGCPAGGAAAASAALGQSLRRFHPL